LTVQPDRPSSALGCVSTASKNALHTSCSPKSESRHDKINRPSP
jgi:hypothetical protein